MKFFFMNTVKLEIFACIHFYVFEKTICDLLDISFPSSISIYDRASEIAQIKTHMYDAVSQCDKCRI